MLRGVLGKGSGGVNVQVPLQLYTQLLVCCGVPVDVDGHLRRATFEVRKLKRHLGAGASQQMRHTTRNLLTAAAKSQVSLRSFAMAAVDHTSASGDLV